MSYSDLGDVSDVLGQHDGLAFGFIGGRNRMTAPEGGGLVSLLLRRGRMLGTLAVLAALAACAQPQQQDSLTEANRYATHARGDYIAPGPPEDPWGPYIREASAKYDVPDQWIRSLMRVESGGHEYINGHLVISSAGAMGLMQVMPATYDMLRSRYGLGDDPYEPHDNIMAGTAYMREMYEIYGTPGFLAAYNAGPARLDDYLGNIRPLPDETRRYVAMIGPNIQGVYPSNRSTADLLAFNQIPLNIPPGRRYSRGTMTASNTRGSHAAPQKAPVEVAQMPDPARKGQTTQVASSSRGGFRLISTANAADAAPAQRGVVAPGQWAIQIGAFNTQDLAHAQLNAARSHAGAELAVAHASVSGVKQGKATLYRARMTGLSRDTAVQACEKITHSRGSCIVLSPDAQS